MKSIEAGAQWTLNSKDMNQKTSPKDVFLQIWTAASLFVSGGGLIALLFQYVNYWFPDVANPSYGLSDAVRWAIAILVTIFPSYLAASIMLNRAYLKSPEKRESRLRKWLLYFTLFVAAIALIGDLAVTVYNFLGGELSLRFFLKVLAVGLVAGAVFGYYFYDLRRQTVRITPMPLLAIRVGVGAIMAIVIGAFFIAGSPFTQRLIKIDLQRVSNLQEIQSQIVFGYWQPKKTLPPSLDVLRNEISGFIPPRDPATGNPYEYRVTGPLSFELCATFDAASAAAGNGRAGISEPHPVGAGLQAETWEHGTGHACFARTIDPELFKAKFQ